MANCKSDYARMLKAISSSLSEKEFDHMIDLCENCFSPDEIKNFKNEKTSRTDFLRELETKKPGLAEDDLSFFIELLKNVNRNDLARKVDTFSTAGVWSDDVDNFAIPSAEPNEAAQSNENLQEASGSAIELQPLNTGSDPTNPLQDRESNHQSENENLLDKNPESLQEESPNLRVYKSRFWMLAVFVLVGFCQYCAWNIYGPIATTAKTVFKWSNSEIAILANMDPITHILTMMAFSKLMDTKGLRTTMLVSVAFMAIGTGLRCVTSDPRYCIWSMSVGQLFNGLGGPIAQAGPTLLTSFWFPPSQRATATAVASMAGSFGLAMSFLISPGFVTDVKKELDALNPKPLNHSANINSILARYTNTTVPLKDSVYFEAKHYWPLDKLNIKSTNTIMKSVRNSSNTTSSPTRSTEVMSKVIDIKSHQEGFAFGRIQLGPGVINQSVFTNGQNAWLNLGDFRNTCLSEPSLCDQGLTVSFWIRYHATQQHLQFFMGTSGTQHGDRGFLVYQDTNNHLSIKVENSKLLWERSFTAPSDTWLHVMFTWDSKEGLSVYLNGSLVGVDEQGKATYPISPYFTTLTVGRPNDVKVFCNASFDEIAVWYRKLRQVEIQSIYNRLINKKPIDEKYEKAKEKLLDKARNEIMMLLYIEFGVVAMLFIVVVIYFPNKPPSPPSKSAQEKREDFLPGLKMIFRNLQFWKLALLYGVTTGVYSGWGALLAVNLEKFDVSQIQVGGIGFIATLAGIASAIVVGRIADKWNRRMKTILVFLIFGSTMCFLWFLLLYLKAFPFEYFSLYLSNIFGGIFVNGAIPISYELAVEATHPVAEGVTNGLLTLINNFFTVVFLAVEIIPGVGTVWMNWFMLFACAVCIPIMFTFREKYGRRDVDEGRQLAPAGNDP